MTSLYDYLRNSAKLDANGTWSWQCNPEIHSIAADDLNSWAEENNKKNIIIVPVTGWYETNSDRKFAKAIGGLSGSNPEIYVRDVAAEYNLSVNDSIKKLLFTDAMSHGSQIKTPSWFVSPESGSGAIKKGDEFVLVDDVIESGGTIRDLVKHINLRGGIVRGVVNVDLGDMIITGGNFHPQSASKRGSEEVAAMLYAASNNLWGKIEEIHSSYRDYFKPLQVAEGKKVEIIHEIKNTADKHLNEIGLGWDQLTGPEFNSLYHVIKDSNSSDFSQNKFWQKNLSHFPAFLPAPVERITRLQELSNLLGTEFEAKWTKQKTDNNKPNELGIV